MQIERVMILAGTLLLLAAEPQVAASQGSRQAEVRERSAAVMPFDMAATTHVFTKTAHGGTQRVLAKRADEAAQVVFIRQHLRELAERFRRRDFEAPTHVHGASMPGLESLRSAAATDLAIDYSDVPAGGEISYRSANERIIEAVHRWFDAQVSDHGVDARMGHEHPMSHDP